MNIIKKDEIGIIFIQERYLYRNRYVGINKKYRIFSSGIDQNRAAIVFSNSDESDKQIAVLIGVS